MKKISRLSLKFNLKVYASSFFVKRSESSVGDGSGRSAWLKSLRLPSLSRGESQLKLKKLELIFKILTFKKTVFFLHIK